jgi:hypothetical protein
MSAWRDLAMKGTYTEEIQLQARNGMGMLILSIALLLAAIAAIIGGAVLIERGVHRASGGVLLASGILYFCVSWIPFMGLKILKAAGSVGSHPVRQVHRHAQGRRVLLCQPVCFSGKPSCRICAATATEDENPTVQSGKRSVSLPRKVISLKAMTLNNNKQKVNDELGNPVEIGIVVIWRVVNTAKAVFNVDNYKAFLSIQCDSALRDIAKQYPYDVEEDGEMSLRGSSTKVAEQLKAELQSRVDIAGLEIVDARITHPRVRSRDSRRYAPKAAGVGHRGCEEDDS